LRQVLELKVLLIADDADEFQDELETLRHKL
jgi:hypothetical protein